MKLEPVRVCDLPANSFAIALVPHHAGLATRIVRRATVNVSKDRSTGLSAVLLASATDPKAAPMWFDAGTVVYRLPVEPPRERLSVKAADRPPIPTPAGEKIPTGVPENEGGGLPISRRYGATRKLIPFTLRDPQDDCEAPARRGNIELTSDSIAIVLDGYGEYTAVTGRGSPILIELFDGKPRVIVWSDINQEDPTHVIDMTKAMEMARRPHQSDAAAFQPLEPAVVPVTPPVASADPLPKPDDIGDIRLPDGCRIYSYFPSPKGKPQWRASWSDGTPVIYVDGGVDRVMTFASSQGAYAHILQGK